MHIDVPLNRLKFGQEDGAGINARVTGRQDGIEELAANLNARGQIENLVVKACGDDFYSVSNGNRRLAAFHLIYGETSAQRIRCTLRDVDEDGAFEDSLTTAVTAKQLHPVDQYEAFARLRDRGSKTTEEIARVYGMTEREVDQALALGHLSPKIREAWRKGAIKAAAAKAFTLAGDHKTQDDVLEQLRAQDNGMAPDFDDDDVKDLLKIDTEAGSLSAWRMVGSLVRIASGVLPKELRTVHYAGPGSEGYKRPPADVAAAKEDLATAMGDALDRAKGVRKAKADRATKAGENKMKRAAAANKPVTKTSAKR